MTIYMIHNVQYFYSDMESTHPNEHNVVDHRPVIRCMSMMYNHQLDTVLCSIIKLSDSNEFSHNELPLSWIFGMEKGCTQLF